MTGVLLYGLIILNMHHLHVNKKRINIYRPAFNSCILTNNFASAFVVGVLNADLTDTCSELIIKDS